MRTIGTASLVESHCFDFGAHAVRGLSGAGFSPSVFLFCISCFVYHGILYFLFVYPISYTREFVIKQRENLGFLKVL